MKISEYTKYERARIIGARALQIAMGAPILLKLGKDDLEKLKYNPINIAKREFEEGILPIVIKRPFPEKAKR
ncbi:DNA-directed RNA polymerase subunit K [Candidatus Woesearchaeota archaeon]|nr:DNA-directed RNA polymerase subunit K [Candidatus Woesearchaeota archaeon]